MAREGTKLTYSVLGSKDPLRCNWSITLVTSSVKLIPLPPCLPEGSLAWRRPNNPMEPARQMLELRGLTAFRHIDVNAEDAADRTDHIVELQEYLVRRRGLTRRPVGLQSAFGEPLLSSRTGRACPRLSPRQSPA